MLGIASRYTEIIPACAGSTRLIAFCAFVATDHPRLRGEHTSRWLVVLGARESSPLARGAHWVYEATEERLLIIPACAGSTLGIVRLRLVRRDHPRLRGEHTSRASTSAT